ncbi:hypothetical protein BTO30_07175 [Domibacillus antri]|uniref:Uncharacterized protein n=1 Tax=Domibacillus antri TaxID=1714264 RepID=A0A1Q8Q6G2_9BACI|nr:hypothetical protein [Domibacillus antri]OLN22919.1 hypothetical protein BTO30_07175 [Domibacillus antri]
MRKRFLSLFLSAIFLISMSVPVYAYEEDIWEEPTGTPYEMLEKEGITLKHFIITYKPKRLKTGYYSAVSSSGEIIRFQQEDIEIEMNVGDRVRSYWQDDQLNLVEYLEPELIDYKVSRIWNEYNVTYYEGISEEHGGIIFTNDNIIGSDIKAGDVVAAEFDWNFIENGLINVHKKG